MLDDVTNRTEAIGYYPAHIQTTALDIELRWLTRKEEIRHEFTSLYDVITSGQNQLLAFLEEEVRKALQQLMVVKDDYNNIMADTCQLSDECVDAVQHLTSEQFWGKYSQLLDRLSQLEKRACSLTPADDLAPAFVTQPFSLYKEKLHIHQSLRPQTFCWKNVVVREHIKSIPYDKLHQAVTLDMLIEIPDGDDLPPSSTLFYHVDIYTGANRALMLGRREWLKAPGTVLNGPGEGVQLLMGSLYMLKVMPCLVCTKQSGLESTSGRTVTILVVTGRREMYTLENMKLLVNRHEALSARIEEERKFLVTLRQEVGWKQIIMDQMAKGHAEQTESHEGQMVTLREELAAKEAMIDQMTETHTKQMTDQKEHYDERLLALHKELEDKQTAMDQMKEAHVKQMEDLREQHEKQTLALREKLDNTQAVMDKMQRSARASGTLAYLEEIVDKEIMIDKLNQELETQRAEAGRQQQEESALRGELAKRQALVEQLKQRVQMLVGQREEYKTQAASLRQQLAKGEVGTEQSDTLGNLSNRPPVAVEEAETYSDNLETEESDQAIQTMLAEKAKLEASATMASRVKTTRTMRSEHSRQEERAAGQMRSDDDFSELEARTIAQVTKQGESDPETRETGQDIGTAGGFATMTEEDEPFRETYCELLTIDASTGDFREDDLQPGPGTDSDDDEMRDIFYLCTKVKLPSISK